MITYLLFLFAMVAKAEKPDVIIVDFVRLVPYDLTKVSWPAVEAEAKRQCQDFTRVGEFDQVAELHIQAIDSLVTSLDYSLVQVAKLQRKAEAAYNAPPYYINTEALQNETIQAAAEITAKAQALRGEAHGLSDQPPLTATAKPQRRLHGLKRARALNACSVHLVKLVDHLVSIEYMLNAAESEINLTLLGLHIAMPKRGPQLVLQLPRRPKASPESWL